MSMIYCHKHDRLVDTDWHEDCPECLVEIEWSPTVELIQHKDCPQSRWSDMWAVAQYLEAPATAIPHWHIWTYYSDMQVAMTEAMEGAKKGGQWALVCPKPSPGWKSEKHLNEALSE